VIGIILKGFRKTHQISMEKMSADIGITLNAYFRIEHGKPVRSEVMMQLLNWLFKSNLH